MEDCGNGSWVQLSPSYKSVKNWQIMQTSRESDGKRDGEITIRNGAHAFRSQLVMYGIMMKHTTYLFDHNLSFSGLIYEYINRL